MSLTHGAKASWPTLGRSMALGGLLALAIGEAPMGMGTISKQLTNDGDRTLAMNANYAAAVRGVNARIPRIIVL